MNKKNLHERSIKDNTKKNTAKGKAMVNKKPTGKMAPLGKGRGR